MRTQRIIWSILLLLAAVYACAMLRSVSADIRSAREELTLLQQRVERLERENAGLQYMITEQSEDRLKMLAREELGLAAPESRVLYIDLR